MARKAQICTAFAKAVAAILWCGAVCAKVAKGGVKNLAGGGCVGGALVV